MDTLLRRCGPTVSPGVWTHGRDGKVARLLIIVTDLLHLSWELRQ